MLNATQPPRRMRFSHESRALFLPVRARRRPRPPAVRAARPAIACGGATRKAAGRRCLIGRRCQGTSRAACRVSSSGRSWPRASMQERPADRRRSARPAASTVWKVLRRYGASRLPRPARGPVVRYERPGELVHVDIKRLGRFWTIGKRFHKDGLARNRHAGWQYLHLAIDVDRPRSGGQWLVRRLVVVLVSFSRSRSVRGSRVSSGA